MLQKPTSTYALEAVENQLSKTFGTRCFKIVMFLDMTFACVGAVDALHNSIDWVNNGKGRKAVVIASDFANTSSNLVENIRKVLVQ